MKVELEKNIVTFGLSVIAIKWIYDLIFLSNNIYDNNIKWICIYWTNVSFKIIGC